MTRKIKICIELAVLKLVKLWDTLNNKRFNTIDNYNN